MARFTDDPERTGYFHILLMVIKHSEGRSFIGAIKGVRGFTSILDSNRADTNFYPTIQSFKHHNGPFFE